MVWPNKEMLAVRLEPVLAVKEKLTTPLATPVMVSHGLVAGGSERRQQIFRRGQHHRQ